MFDGAFLISWNDIAGNAEDEYRRWHRTEHMPERLAVPGFSLGRRYTDLGGARYRYLTVYEVESTEVFRSAPYRARLAEPTPWTRRMSAQMTNFVRRVCRTAASAGDPVGAAAATLRLRIGTGLPEAAEALVRAALAIDGVIAAHVGAVDEGTTQVRTDEMQTRNPTDAFDAVLIAESDSRTALADCYNKLAATVAVKAGPGALVLGQTYDLAFALRRTGRAPS